MTHKCPGRAALEEVDPSQLLCPRCWYQVPKPIRRAVHIAWNRGAGARAPAHRAAVRLAVAAIRREVIPASSIEYPDRGFAQVREVHQAERNLNR